MPKQSRKPQKSGSNNQLNSLYQTIVWKNQAPLFIAFALIIMLLVVVLLLFYFFDNDQWIYGIYFLPLTIGYLIIWKATRNLFSNNEIEYILNGIFFLVLGTSFFVAYFLIFYSILHVKYEQADSCSVLSTNNTLIINPSSSENYTQILLLINKDSESFLACGCQSDNKYNGMRIQNPQPYEYIFYGETLLSDDKKPNSKYNFSQVKLPSWICKSPEEQITNQTCFYAPFKQGSTSIQQLLDQAKSPANTVNFCVEQSEFFQTTFQQPVYYSQSGFYCLIIFLLYPWILYSTTWPIILLSHYLYNKLICFSNRSRLPVADSSSSTINASISTEENSSYLQGQQKKEECNSQNKQIYNMQNNYQLQITDNNLNSQQKNFIHNCTNSDNFYAQQAKKMANSSKDVEFNQDTFHIQAVKIKARSNYIASSPTKHSKKKQQLEFSHFLSKLKSSKK